MRYVRQVRPRAEQKTQINELLGLVGLEHLTDRPARRLSGGEQQRLALARALARDPTALFLDEPTASLDPAGTKAIEDVIRAVSQRGIKVVMSTHDLGEARRLAGEIIMLHRGRFAMPGLARRFSSPCARIKRPAVTAIILAIASLASVDGLTGKSKTSHCTKGDAEYRRGLTGGPGDGAFGLCILGVAEGRVHTLPRLGRRLGPDPAGRAHRGILRARVSQAART